MNNALSQPQTIVLLGGTSDIGRAIVRALASPNLRTVVLACRHPEEAAVDELGLAPAADGGPTVSVVPFDAVDHAGHAGLVERLVAEHGDLDVVIQAFGQLGRDVGTDPVAAARLVEVNHAGAVSSGLVVAEQLRRQGHGKLIVVSSVAGIRTRASNFVYGSGKAGQDAFATGLGLALHQSGAGVLTVRPGFVRSSMTAGMDPAPFAVDPDDVGEAVAEALRRDKQVIWVPGILRYVFAVLRSLPDPIWRRLDR